MQETRPVDMPEDVAKEAGKLRQEFFAAENEELLQAKMDARLEKLEAAGETLTRRVSIEGDEIPSVVKQMVMGILGAHNRTQRRRMKAQAIKLIESL